MYLFVLYPYNKRVNDHTISTNHIINPILITTIT